MSIVVEMRKWKIESVEHKKENCRRTERTEKATVEAKIWKEYGDPGDVSHLP